jgi:hypothetical protein
MTEAVVRAVDPTLGNHAVFLVDRCEGRRLEGDSPLRLVVPGEAEPVFDPTRTLMTRWFTFFAIAAGSLCAHCADDDGGTWEKGRV